ncbi:GreA/GreB family elongation factor [Candidatus Saccharibacteria bacterium]|nr:GreA/GreB family elongation factor [Candidatus Saccharibacteria bacterium]
MPPRADLGKLIDAKKELDGHTSDHAALDIHSEKHEKQRQDVVEIGSTVVIELLGDKPEYLTVVVVPNKDEFAGQDGQVPIIPDSPIAKGIIGRVAGDEEISVSPTGGKKIKIIRVTNPEQPE